MEFAWNQGLEINKSLIIQTCAGTLTARQVTTKQYD